MRGNPWDLRLSTRPPAQALAAIGAALGIDAATSVTVEQFKTQVVG
jgi:hypothetical protein